MNKIQVLVFGDEVVATKFSRMRYDILDASPAFENIADYLFKSTAATFDSQGRRGGGSWKFLTGKWLSRKARHGWDTRILHKGKGTPLRKSVTVRGAPGQILDITPHSILFGSSLEYATRHQFGYKQTPKRSFIKLTPGDRLKTRQMIRDHLMQAWRAHGTAI
jgi:phage gpG-like protein